MDHHRGFMLLAPLLAFSLAILWSVSLLAFKAGAFEHALRRHESFVAEKHEEEACLQLRNLYVSYDPYFVSEC